jgi:hypothetical protein
MERSLRLQDRKAGGATVDQQVLIALIVVAVVVLVGAYAYATQQKRRRLRDRFGPEYERTVEVSRNVAEAETALKERLDRVSRFKLHPLSAEQAEAFAAEWRRVQTRFVDDPHAAVGEADHLVSQVMAARGYPPGEFEKRADDLSVDHPRVVENYRIAQKLMDRLRRGEAGTEELRVAIINYRALFDDLLQVDEPHRRRAS